MSHTKCTQHQKYDCTVCTEFEGPVARGRKLEAEVARLKATLSEIAAMSPDEAEGEAAIIAKRALEKGEVK